MDEKSNHKADFSSIEDRIHAFRNCMVSALHLFPQDITERLTESGFFTAPASAKYHGAYEGGLFDHSRNVTSVLVTLTHYNDLEWQRPESHTSLGCSMIFVSRISIGILPETRYIRPQAWSSVPKTRTAGNTSPIRCSRGMATNPSCCFLDICRLPWKKSCASGITWAPSWIRRSGMTTPGPSISIRTSSGRIRPT